MSFITEIDNVLTNPDLAKYGEAGLEFRGTLLYNTLQHSYFKAVASSRDLNEPVFSVGRPDEQECLHVSKRLIANGVEADQMISLLQQDRGQQIIKNEIKQSPRTPIELIYALVAPSDETAVNVSTSRMFIANALYDICPSSRRQKTLLDQMRDMQKDFNATHTTVQKIELNNKAVMD